MGKFRSGSEQVRQFADSWRFLIIVLIGIVLFWSVSFFFFFFHQLLSDSWVHDDVLNSKNSNFLINEFSELCVTRREVCRSKDH